MSEESTGSGQGPRSAAEVERIRDIIFGPQMRLYEKQFKRLAGQLEALGGQVQELKATIEQQQIAQESRARQLQDELQGRSGKLDQLESGLEQVRADLTAQIRKLTTELQEQRRDLQSEFSASLDALEDVKTSRDDLGDLLMEMGTRLKGQMGFADLLGQLEDIAQEPLAD